MHLDERRPWGRPDAWIAVGLVWLALAARWPLRVGGLEEFDSANFALGVRELDLARHQPHPPGYLLLIWAARGLQVWLPDPVTALASVSALSGAASVGLFYALLRTTWPGLLALPATVVCASSAQVWFQHVRPLSDAFALFWMLAALWFLVRAQEGSFRWWVAGCFVTGVALGSKQMMGLFVAGPVLAAAIEQLRLRGRRVVFLGGLAGALGVLVWLAPLVAQAGSLSRYLNLSTKQLRFQEVDGLAFNFDPARAAAYWRSTTATIWLHRDLTVLMWLLIAAGTIALTLGPARQRWLVWVAIPPLACRLTFLGPFPRYSLYGLPFLCALAVYGLFRLTLLATRVVRRLRPALVADGAVPRVAAGVLGAFAVTFAAVQVERALPTLRALHAGPFPMPQALEYLASHVDRASSLLLVEDGLLARQLDYLAPGTALRHRRIARLREGDLLGVRRVFVIQPWRIPLLAGPWQVHARRRGEWSLKVPRWDWYSPQSEFLRVRLFEIYGPYVAFRGWDREDPRSEGSPRRAGGRSRILLYHVPPEGFTLRLRLESPGGGGARFVVNRGRAFEWDGATREALVEVSHSDARAPRVRIDVEAACVAPAPAACLYLSGLSFHLRGGSASDEDGSNGTAQTPDEP